MVLQRIQSLFLLLAFTMMGVFSFTPLAVEPAAQATRHYIYEAPVALVLSLLATVLLAITIFLYKNLRLQMKTTLLCMLLTAADIATAVLTVKNMWPDASFYWFGGILLPAVALVMMIAAYRSMRKDHKLLRSMDRLR